MSMSVWRHGCSSTQLHSALSIRHIIRPCLCGACVSRVARVSRHTRQSVEYLCLCTHCNTLQHISVCVHTLQHTATHICVCAHTATHCNTGSNVCVTASRVCVTCRKGLSRVCRECRVCVSRVFPHSVSILSRLWRHRLHTLSPYSLCLDSLYFSILSMQTLCIQSRHSNRNNPPPPGAFPMDYLPSSRTVCKRTPLEEPGTNPSRGVLLHTLLEEGT